MAQKVLVPLDFSKLEALNFRFQNLATAPSSPALGQAYLDTDDNIVYFHNGTTWVAMGGLTDEYLQDLVGAMVSGNTETGIAVSYDDTNGKLDFAVADEYIQDLIGAMVTGNTETGITVTYQDSDGTIDFEVGVLNSLPAPTGDLSLNSQKITNLATPTAATDAANKSYVDGLANGVDWKASVRVATTAAGTLASSFENGDTVDGVTLATGDRILIKDQSTASENGIYVVAASGAPARATDADASAEVTSGLAVFVEEGTTNADTAWVLTTNNPITLGTTGLTFTQFSGLGQITAGAALTKTGNTLDVAVDNSTIEVSSDALRVKDAGITDAKLASTFTKKYSTTVGDGSSTSINVDHNLNTRAVVVEVYDSSTFETVICDITRSTVNRVVLAFANAPASGAYTVVVIG